MHLDHARRKTAALLAMTLSCLSSCAVDVASQGDRPDRVELALSGTTSESFEAYAPGPLGAPWTTSAAGSSTVRVVSTSDHGKVAVLHGGTTSGDFIIASLAASSSDPLMHAELALNPAVGASFVFSLEGAGSSIGARRVRLQRVAGSTKLSANTSAFGTHDCGELPSGRWSTVTLDVRTDLHTFDVTINGAATACSAGSTQIGTPFSGVSLMDASNEGFGGDVQFDDIALSGDAAPPCTPPATPPRDVFAASFDGDPLGTLSAPWAVTQSSRRLSTVSVVSASGHGRALQLHGSTRSGELVIAARTFAAAATQTDLRFDLALRPSSGASFVLALNGAGGSLGARRIRLQRAAGSTTLVADTAGSSNLSCGTLASNVWSSVSLRIHTQSMPHTFDVLINGAPTACTGAPTEMGTPFDGLNVMDASNPGWGGDVLFDDLAVTASGPPAGSCP